MELEYRRLNSGPEIPNFYSRGEAYSWKGRMNIENKETLSVCI